MNELLIKQNKSALKTIPAMVFLVFAFFTFSSYLSSGFSAPTQALLGLGGFFLFFGGWHEYLIFKRKVLINKLTSQIEITEFSFFGTPKHNTYSLGDFSSVQSYITRGKASRNIVELVTTDGNRGLLLSSFFPGGGKKF